MFGNYIKIALRIIKRNKVYSILNILGLAMGMAAFILIFLYVRYELSYDRYHENSDRIYRVARETSAVYLGKNKWATTRAPLATALIEFNPEIIAATRFGRNPQNQKILISYGEKSFLEQAVHWVDSQIFKVFSIPFLKGDPKTALRDPFSIVVSQSMAEKYFGTENPLGKVLNYQSEFDFKVTGVFKDFPENSHFSMDLMVPFDTLKKVNPRISLDSWRSPAYYYTYFLLEEGADTDELQGRFSAIIEKYAGDNSRLQKQKYFFQPLTKIHLYSNLNWEHDPNNDVKYIYLFSFIALLILIIACINYMNLATARSSQRAREVGMRKIVGAQRIQLVKQFLGESVFLTLMAFLLTFVFVLVMLPAFNVFLETQIKLNPLDDALILLGFFAVVAFVGLFAGSYPALYISSFKPLSILRGSFSSTSKGRLLRNALVVFQFFISISLILSTIIVRNQLNYMMNKDMGYSREQIVALGLRGRNARSEIETIKTELKRYPDILAVTSSSNLPNYIQNQTLATWPGKPKDLIIPIYFCGADYDFVDLFELEIVQGRNFSRDFPSDANGAFLINETALKALGWDSPLGRVFFHWQNKERAGKIVGVVKDFHLHSLHQEIKPLYILLSPTTYRYLSLKIRGGDLPKTMGYIKERMKEFFPSYPFEYSFFDDIFDRTYKTEQKLSSLFSFFSLFAVLIACLGLFGLSSFTAEQRTKEIGIRKVLGASIPNITVLLSREFIKWVLLANILALPLGIFAMSKWLQGFAYRIQLGVVPFLMATSVTIVIAVLTVSFQTLRAATANPVDSLRFE